MHEMLLVKLGYRIVLTRRLPKFSSGKESRTSKAICNDTPNIDITIVAGVPELDQDVSARTIEDGQRTLSDGIQQDFGIHTQVDQT